MTRRPWKRRLGRHLLTFAIGGMVGGILFGGTLLGGVKVNHLWQRSQMISDCPGSRLSASNGPLIPVHPAQVTVEPWKGRHNVYAVFLVPNGYHPDEFVTIALPNGQTYCGHRDIMWCADYCAPARRSASYPLAKKPNWSSRNIGH
jgi:hypothetical protein